MNIQLNQSSPYRHLPDYASPTNILSNSVLSVCIMSVDVDAVDVGYI